MDECIFKIFKSGTVQCQKCGSEDVMTSFDFSQGSDETGVYGESIGIECRKCDNEWSSD